MNETDTKQESRLGTDPILPLMRQLAMPAILGQVINILYNIVDRMYVGHIPEIGSLALTGLGVSSPLVLLISAFASFIIGGGAPLAAISLGRDDREEAEHLLGTSAGLLIIMGAALTVLGLIFKRPLLYLFGASDATILYAEQYISWYLLGTIFVMISLGLNAFISAQGEARHAMISVLIGAVANIVLDPIFIYAMKLGVAGAAIATIISQSLSAFYVLRFLTSDRSAIRLQSSKMRPDPRLSRRIYLTGSGTFVMSSTESAISLVFNRGLLHYGSDLHVAAMTIMQSVMQLLTVPLAGFTSGVQPLVSFNYGAKKVDRLKQVLRYSMIFCVSATVIYWLFVQLFPGAFGQIFSSDQALLDLVRELLPIYTFGMFMIGIQMVAQMFFVGTGQAKHSLFIALLRKVIILIPLAIILPRFMGVKGVITAEPIADITAAATSGIMLWQAARHLYKEPWADEEAHEYEREVEAEA